LKRVYFYSFIIPLYNRPDEIRELLESLTRQTYKEFEVIVVEDGSTISGEAEVQKFSDQLDVKYFFKENGGQGFARNYGFERAKGDYFLVLDSDVILPEHYLAAIEERLASEKLDAFGGPDAAHPSFTITQKAISYAMTSLFTTGGIRGGKKHLGKFQPRSFNMGISKEVYKKIGGYAIPRLGEDLEFSLRIIKAGYKTGLIPEAFVYHKRRTDLRKFYHQLHFFGRSRINNYRFYPDQLKLMHWFPFVFLLYCLCCLISLFAGVPYIYICLPLALWTLALFIDALIKEKNLAVSLVGVLAAFIQLNAYGIGFITDFIKFKFLGLDPAADVYPS